MIPCVPEVTVVIPTRNRAQLLHRLLRSLELVQFPLLEIIVVDEGSTDETPTVIEQHHSSQHVIRSERNDPPRGLPAARNQGLALATTPWISWIDDDDLSSPERFRLQLESMAATGARWSFSGRVDIDDQLQVIGAMRLPSDEALLTRLLEFNVMPAAAQGLLVDVALARDLGGFDESLGAAEDWDFCIRLASAAAAAAVDLPLVGYRLVDASMSSDTARMDRAIDQVVQKHAALAARLGVRVDFGRLDESLIAAELRSGSRWRSARRMLRVMRRGRVTVRRLARLGLIVASPDRAFAQSASRRRAVVDPAWKTAAEDWLGRVRVAELSS